MKKVGKILSSVLLWILAIAAVLMMIFAVFSTNVFDQENKSAFGRRFFVVKEDAAGAGTLQAGDVVMASAEGTAGLQIGDLVVCRSEEAETFGEYVICVFRGSITATDGTPLYRISRGAEEGAGESSVSVDSVLGRYVGVISGVGTFYSFLRTTRGYVICLLLPFMILIFHLATKAVQLLQSHRAEKADQDEETAEELAAQRRQSEAMQAEIESLRRQLAEQRASAEAGASAPVETSAPAVEAPAAAAEPEIEMPVEISEPVGEAPAAAPVVAAEPEIVMPVEESPRPVTEAPAAKPVPVEPVRVLSHAAAKTPARTPGGTQRQVPSVSAVTSNSALPADVVQILANMESMLNKLKDGNP